MCELVSLNSVSKSYARQTIFCNATMSVTTTKLTVIMGNNGCGKSTLLKIIAGVLVHTNGEIIRTPNIKISFMPDRFPKLPFEVGEYLMHMGRIIGLTNDDVEKYMSLQFDYFGIPKSIKKQKIFNCSKGTIQKINIMQALISGPNLLVMDEPFSGLDESATNYLVELLTKMPQSKMAVILSCHEKLLAQQLTDNLFVFTLEDGVYSVNPVAKEANI